jgi:hypothetical protein
VRTSNGGVCLWLFALGLAGVQVEATASCDISGSNVMFQGIEKRDGTSTSAAQKPAQSKAEPRGTSTATPSNPPR